MVFATGDPSTLGNNMVDASRFVDMFVRVLPADALRGDEDVGLPAMAWNSSRELMRALINRMGEGRFVVLVANRLDSLR